MSPAVPDTCAVADGGAGATAAPANPWAKYAWLMAAIWVVFLVFPVMAVARLDGPLWVQPLGYVLVAAFGTVYVLSFLKVPGGLGRARESYRIAWAFFGALAAVAAACIPIIGLDTLSFSPSSSAWPPTCCRRPPCGGWAALDSPPPCCCRWPQGRVWHSSR